MKTQSVYLIVKRDKLDGRVFETRVSQSELATHIEATFTMTDIEIIAIVKL
jgi:hypothetical protein